MDRPKQNPDWTYEEAILLLALYRRNPAAAADDPGVIELSRRLNASAGRRGVTPSATYRNPTGVAMRLRNLNGIDPAYAARSLKGLPGGPRIDKIVWARFSESPAELAAAEAEILASWAIAEPSRARARAEPSRGPTPSFGTRLAQRRDGPTDVYLLQLAGPLERLLGAGVPAPLKIGLSNAVARRIGELNEGLPAVLALQWTLVRTWPRDTGVGAWALERASLLAAHAAGWCLGGEFVGCSVEDATALIDGLAARETATLDRADETAVP